MKKFLILLTLTCNICFAQETIHKCYSTEQLNLLEELQPGTKANVNALFETAKAHALAHPSAKSGKSIPDTVYRIPVVFHIVYNGPNQNTNYALLESQMAVLNEDYRRLNIDTSNTRPIFKDRAGDVGFEFFFATIDPDGNPTNGVTRTPTTTTFSFFNLDAMKSSSSGGKDAWDTDKYLNIWVCDLGGLILGFAYPPAAAPNWPTGQTPGSPNDDGVVIHYEVIGKNNPLAVGQLSIADQGRTAVHEVGHYWGLRHIWGDSGDIFTGAPDCNLGEDDGFSDTPHMGNNSQTAGCSFSKNTCINGEAPDEPDMVENYMDYSTESCQNMFTQQQADLMRSMTVVGRPNVVRIIQDEEFELVNGDWIVVNGTDTFQIGPGLTISLTAGDQVMFLNENNGFDYTVTNTNVSFTGAALAEVTEDGDAFFTDVTTGIKNISQTKVSIFPNPTKDVFTIQHAFEGAELNMEIYNQMGQKVMEGSLNAKIEQFSSSELGNGVYFIMIRNQFSTLSVSKLHVLK